MDARVHSVSAISAALTERGRALGTWVLMDSPETGELAAAAGFDFVLIDMEHGALDLPATAHGVRAVQGRGADAVVRVPTLDPSMIGRVLDVGARGVLVPGIRSPDDARRAAAAAHFAPRGERGACPFVPAFDDGLLPWGPAAPHVWLLIEHPQAVADITDVAAVAAEAGATALVLGPFDLAVAMGLDGDHHHPEVRRALDQVLRAADTTNLDVVAVTLEPDAPTTARAVQEWRAAGCRLTTALLDRHTLAHAYRSTLTEIDNSS